MPLVMQLAMMDPVFITKSELLNSKGIYFSGQDTEFASAFKVISFHCFNQSWDVRRVL
jgi:hypothetical protein